MTKLRAALSVCIWIVCAVVVLAAPCALAGESFLGLTFPDEIGGAVIGQLTDYEKSLPGLGYSAAYQRPGWKTDVYIYNLRSVVPADLLSPAVKNELNRTKGEVFDLQKRGAYTDVVGKGDFTLADRGRTRFLCAAFAFFHSQVRAKVDSFLCLTSWKGQFVKFRLTTPQHASARAEARQFVQAWFKVLWPAGITVQLDPARTPALRPLLRRPAPAV